MCADLVEGQVGFLTMTVPLMRRHAPDTHHFWHQWCVYGRAECPATFCLCPALASILYNVGIILVASVLLAPNVMGMGVGTVVGALGPFAHTTAWVAPTEGALQPLFLLCVIKGCFAGAEADGPPGLGSCHSAS
jgi:hypothetical protein